MAISVLTTIAKEESTYIIVVSFFDEDGVAMTPNTVNWTLTDLNGTIINSKSAVPETPGAIVNIVLSGDDLQILGNFGHESREVLVYGTYNSDYGTDLPYNEAVQFTIDNLAYVT